MLIWMCCQIDSSKFTKIKKKMLKEVVAGLTCVKIYHIFLIYFEWGETNKGF